MAIRDTMHRPLRDLRISVTDRCNFRCRYCMPAEVFDGNYPFLPREEILNFDEITRVARVAVKLGVRKIRLTGGEPLMRRNLPTLIAQLRAIKGLEDLAMTSNAALLASKAKDLKHAGLDRITISLDALDETIFANMNGVGAKPDKVLAGIEAAQHAGLQIKLNAVIKRGVNEGEILPLVEFAKKRSVHVRFIEFMDVGETNRWQTEEVVDSEEIRSILSNKYKLSPVQESSYGQTARNYQLSGSGAQIGFISSVSQPFCSSCTRARLSADGQIFTCLFSNKGHQLKNILRSQADDTLLENTLKSIWTSRTDRYSEERQESSISQSGKPEMSFIGG